jgi:hypothetical protein
MSTTTKVRWLRPVLLLKILACLFVWGLPALLVLPAVLALLLFFVFALVLLYPRGVGVESPVTS